MENTLEQNERNALKILLLATEQYLKTQDELGRNFIAPQANAAAELLANALNSRWGAIPAESQVVDAESDEVTKQ